MLDCQAYLPLHPALGKNGASCITMLNAKIYFVPQKMTEKSQKDSYTVGMEMYFLILHLNRGIIDLLGLV